MGFQIDGLRRIPHELKTDERGSLFESLSHERVAQFRPIHGIQTFSKAKAARGLHFQHAPHSQNKLIQVLKGSILDLVLDLKSGQLEIVPMQEKSGFSLFVPKHCAHGLIALEDSTVSYLMDAAFEPRFEGGYQIRSFENEITIPWSWEELLISEKDQSWPRWTLEKCFA